MTARTIEDQLREEYFRLLPELTRIADQLTTQIRYAILPISKTLKPADSLLVKTRVKECDSAIGKLRRRTQGRVFDPDKPELYSLLSLRDLVGVRVLAFPSALAIQVDNQFSSEFLWQPDPIRDLDGQELAFKYNGHYPGSTNGLISEYQIVSTLIGLFWEVEHAALYKQAPNFKRQPLSMREPTSAVYRALKAFETEFEHLIQNSEETRGA